MRRLGGPVGRGDDRIVLSLGIAEEPFGFHPRRPLLLFRRLPGGRNQAMRLLLAVRNRRQRLCLGPFPDSLDFPCHLGENLGSLVPH